MNLEEDICPEIRATPLQMAIDIGNWTMNQRKLDMFDSLALPSIDSHPSAAKLRLTTDLPREPGVYLFRDRLDRVLYVGKATNLRSRVRSYFSSDQRRKIDQLLRETERIEHRVTTHLLEAEVAEVRLIREHRPRTTHHDAACGGNVRTRSHHDVVPRSDAEHVQRQLQRHRTVRQRNRMTAANVSGELFLEARAFLSSPVIHLA